MTYDSDEKSIKSGQPVELYKFVLRGTTTEWLFTSAGYDITYSGDKYISTPGLSRDSFEEIEDTLKTELKITMPSNHDFMRLFLFNTPNGIIDLTVYRGHGANFVQYWKGVVRLTNPLTAKGMGLIVLGPPTDALGASFLIRTFQRVCDVPLYSTPCGLTALNYSLSVLLTAVSGVTLTSASLNSQDNGWWVGGYVTFGQIKRKIKSHVDDVITITAQMPGLAAGSSVTVYAGCDHLRATCISKFDNLPNYRGCDWIPDNEPFTQGIFK